MTNTLVNDAKYLSGKVYKNQKYTKNLGYKLLEESEDFGNGFYAESYFKNGNIFVVYRGTDIERGLSELNKDKESDFAMWKSKYIPSQFHNAALFYKFVARKYRNYPIYTTGHSLGGSLAQMVAASIKEPKAITFNAYGTKNLKGFQAKYPENVTNYGNANDAVFSANIENHIGKTLVIGERNPYSFYPQKYHSLDAMGNIESAKEYHPQKQVKTNMSTNHASPKNKIDKVHEMIQRHEEKLKNKKLSATNGKSSSSSGSGRWVTVNGRHVFLEK